MATPVTSTHLTRQTLRNMILMGSVVLCGAAIMAFRQGQSLQVKAQQLGFEQSALRQELENTARLSANLGELDKLTISEVDATRLNIMRHLGIEQHNYDFSINNRQVRMVGGVEIFTRQAELNTQLTYAQSMALLDHLYNTGKFTVSDVEVTASTAPIGDAVAMRIIGNIYALRKDNMEEKGQEETAQAGVFEGPGVLNEEGLEEGLMPPSENPEVNETQTMPMPLLEGSVQ
ncbi:MAG: hypothetical protein COY40_04105 [Alphaproteobacteria bacterium CG_4_10_14_0_8_um_filter_53_9]|nr:MAG: hypothetical protein COY40_04105 [Alphaproteobacteria bacterium CG_4_10_14_0_8_um_filter_53_9]